MFIKHVKRINITFYSKNKIFIKIEFEINVTIKSLTSMSNS